MTERKKVGLALGGGGAKGFAHIGVLKILEKYNIPIDYISGTSVGALIGALYSAEPNAKKLEKNSLETDWNEFFDYTLPSKGLIKGEKIEAFLKKKLDDLKFKDLKIPLFITTFDIKNKQEVIFHKGDVARAVRASISIPGIFVPVENNGRILVDGGLTDLIPTEILKKEGADIIIAVNVDSIKEKKPNFDEEASSVNEKKNVPGIVSTISKSFQIMEAEASKAELNRDKADWVIDIDLEDITTLDFSKIKEAIKKGEGKAKKSIDKLKKMVEPHPIKELLAEINHLPIVSPVVRGIKKNIHEVTKDIKELGK